MKDYKTLWKTLADTKAITAEHFVQLAIIKAMNSKSNSSKEDIINGLLQKYFTPNTNKNKLANGCGRWNGLKIAIYKIHQTAKYHPEILGIPQNEFFDNSTEAQTFYELMEDIRIDKLGRKYVYYFTVQTGLTPEQQGVQAGHALFVLGSTLQKENIKFDPKETYFQWIGVPTEKDLREIIKKHGRNKLVRFTEPDLGNMLTSIAFYPLLWNKREEFKEYALLTH